MAKQFDSWQQTVRDRGYMTERDMLEDLYERSGLSIREIAALIGKSYSTVKHRLEMHCFEFRSRGGANRHKAESDGK